MAGFIAFMSLQGLIILFVVGFLMELTLSSPVVGRRADTLANLLYVIRPNPLRSTPGFDGKDGRQAALSQNIDCDEVFPNIILGDGDTARNKKYLKKLGVTHVLNTAMGQGFGMINTNTEFYRDVKMKFLGFEMMDYPGTNISAYFKEASDFIEDALSNRGKVYVHCLMGISRSSTCIIAFLMSNRGFSAEEALRLVRSRRLVSPNEGFLRQLARLDLSLEQTREKSEVKDDN